MGPSCLGALQGKCKGQHPVIRIKSRGCKSARGGTKTVGAPVYKMVVTNPPADNANVCN